MKVATYQLDELLDQVNSAENVKNKLLEILTIPYVRDYIELNVNDVFINFDIENIKFNDYHRSMAGTLLLNRNTVATLKVILVESETISIEKKLRLLRNLCEMLYVGEAKILISVLSKNLTSLYPNITHELICKALS